MKNIFNLLGAVVITALFALSSCTDPCKDVVCQNGGSCTDGACSCPAGYFGDSCQTHCLNGGTGTNSGCTCASGWEGATCNVKMQERYAGTSTLQYALTENCGGGTYNYTVTVSASSVNILKINFAPLYSIPPGVSWTVSADINNSTPDSFTITSQVPETGFTINGSGTRNSSTGTLNISYSVSNGTATDNCTATLVKI